MRTSEQVTPGHPDKLCDAIADTILDHYLAQDPDARVAVEVLAHRSEIILAGEVTSTERQDHSQITRQVLADIGYSEVWWPGFNEVEVRDRIAPQSPNLNTQIGEGAGDQGIVYGYATNATSELLPPEYVAATKVARHLYEQHLEYPDWVGPDGKATATVNEAGELEKITCSALHRTPLADTRRRLAESIREALNFDGHITVNPAGDFTVGGPAADTGLTGRKIIADSYGGRGRHGGGAFSGKDPSKVDRTGAYHARQLAVEYLQHNPGVSEVDVQLGWAIGGMTPLSIEIEADSRRVTPQGLVWQESPAQIADRLGLRAPAHRHQSAFGHFADTTKPWNQPRIG